MEINVVVVNVKRNWMYKYIGNPLIPVAGMTIQQQFESELLQTTKLVCYKQKDCIYESGRRFNEILRTFKNGYKFTQN